MIYLVPDNGAESSAVTQTLHENGYKVAIIVDAEAGLHLLSNPDFALVVTPVMLEDEVTIITLVVNQSAGNGRRFLFEEAGASLGLPQLTDCSDLSISEMRDLAKWRREEVGLSRVIPRIEHVPHFESTSFVAELAAARAGDLPC